MTLRETILADETLADERRSALLYVLDLQPDMPVFILTPRSAMEIMAAHEYADRLDHPRSAYGAKGRAEKMSGWAQRNFPNGPPGQRNV